MRTRKKFEDDLGLGKQATSKNQRTLNRDGSFNVNYIGLDKWARFNIFHALITMKWWKFNAIVILSYFLINLLFGAIYYFIGMEFLMGSLGKTELEKFGDAFFFSSQTLTTLGYGRISPVGFNASFVAAFESMLGLMGFALITGLLYGKFSRPVAKIVQSTEAVIAPYLDMNAFMFRIANGKKSQLIEVEIQVIFSYNETKDGHVSRRFIQLELERNKVALFPSSWTIVHPIDDNSPLKNQSPKQLEETNAEFYIILKAFEDSFSQTVYWRSSYKFSELNWAAKFVKNITQEADGTVTIDMSVFNKTEKVDLNSWNYLSPIKNLNELV